MSVDALDHIKEFPFTTSQLDLPRSNKVFFVYLSGEKLYKASDKTLYVYLVSDITSPIATYSLSDACYSGMISDNRLYLGGRYYLKIFELTTSLTQPLKPVTLIETKHEVYKTMKNGNQLLLGGSEG
jgi:hypothetical protein